MAEKCCYTKEDLKTKKKQQLKATIVEADRVMLMHRCEVKGNITNRTEISSWNQKHEIWWHEEIPH